MYQIDGTIEGVPPGILFNRIVSLKTGGTKPTPQQEEEAAKERVYRNDNGLYLPAYSLKRALRQGTSFDGLKLGRRYLEPYIRAAVFIEPSQLEFGKSEPDFMLPAYVRIPPGRRGALVYKVRPGLNGGWTLNFTFHILDDHIEDEKLRRALETTGLFIGVCDSRPEYGRFTIKEWRIRK